MYSLFFSIFLLDYLQGIGLLPRVFTYIPELLSVIAGIIVIFIFVVRKSINLTPAYGLIFIFLAVLILTGIFANQVPPETLFVAIRKYLKFLPFFFLPLVYDFSEKEIKGQIIVILGLTLIQLPVALYQRFVESVGSSSGDLIGGTLGSAVRGSGLLTVYLVCAVAILTAFRVRKRISPLTYILLLMAFSIPTMINETKVTLFLLPLALILPAVLVGTGSQKIKNLFAGVFVAVVMLGTFASVYNHFYSRGDRGIAEFFTQEGRVEGYLNRSEEKIGQGRAGRVDAILIPLDILSKKPVSLMLGLGLGNVSHSSLGDEFSGDYYYQYGGYVQSAVSNLIWEIGILGLLLISCLGYLLFKDATHLVKLKGINGDIALGWACVVCIIAIAAFYTNIIGSNAISYLFWYLSGYLVALSAKQRLASNRYSWE